MIWIIRFAVGISFILAIISVGWIGKWLKNRLLAIITGWALLTGWAVFWSLIVPACLYGIIGKAKVAALFPDGTIILPPLCFGWIFAWIIVTIVARRRRASVSPESPLDKA